MQDIVILKPYIWHSRFENKARPQRPDPQPYSTQEDFPTAPPPRARPIAVVGNKNNAHNLELTKAGGKRSLWLASKAATS